MLIIITILYKGFGYKFSNKLHSSNYKSKLTIDEFKIQSDILYNIEITYLICISFLYSQNTNYKIKRIYPTVIDGIILHFSSFSQ